MARYRRRSKWGRLFDEFNERFFGGRLPRYRVVVLAQLKSGQGKHFKKSRIIQLRDDSEDDMQAVLLHEMAHAAANDHHAAKWKAEMQRLRDLGAPVSDIDFAERLGPKSLTREFVLSEAVEYLGAAGPRGNLRQFANGLIRYGFADTGGELIRKYRWLHATFRDARIDQQRFLDAQESLRDRL